MVCAKLYELQTWLYVLRGFTTCCVFEFLHFNNIVHLSDLIPTGEFWHNIPSLRCRITLWLNKHGWLLTQQIGFFIKQMHLWYHVFIDKINFK